MRHKFPRIAVVHNNDFLANLSEQNADKPSTHEADSEVADTAAEIASILTAGGCFATILTLSDSTEELIPALRDLEISAVFNLVESLGNDPSREPEVPQLLEAAGIPYTGNSPTPLRIAHAKDIAKQTLLAHAIPHAEGVTIFNAEDISKHGASLHFPLFVKPARTDASIGIDQKSLVRSYEEMVERVEFLLRLGLAPVLVENYLPGREINAALFPDPLAGDIALTEIDFSKCPKELAPIVTYDCKWIENSPEYLAFSKPCTDSPTDDLYRRAVTIARSAFLAIGGNGYGRVDMRLDAEGQPAVIDINPNPDLHPAAGLAVAARSLGVSYEALILMIAQHASLKEHYASSKITA